MDQFMDFTHGVYHAVATREVGFEKNGRRFETLTVCAGIF
jgi:hypothetical protein